MTSKAFSGIFAWATATFDLATSGSSRFTEGGLWVSGDFFTTLGVHPHLGRVFGRDDDRRGCANPGAVISYAFWQREFAGDPSAIGRTIGIRMALGADRGTVVRMVMREGVILLAGGLITGSMLALAAAKTAGALLFGFSTDVPTTLVMAVTVLTAVAVLASYLPALRASRLEPTEALREE